MAPNFDRLVLGPIFAVAGTKAQFTPAGEDGAIALSTRDASGAANVTGGTAGLIVQSNRPAVRIRVAELACHNLKADDLVDGTLNVCGVAWTIKTWEPIPGPNGAEEGEILALLQRIKT